jgi:hypothetical protein
VGRIVLEFVNLFRAGIFVAMEFVVRFGVSAPLNLLDEGRHIQVRQAPIRRLRVLVPAAFVLAAISGVGVAVLEGTAPGIAAR